jgi:hypothetical protein
MVVPVENGDGQAMDGRTNGAPPPNNMLPNKDPSPAAMDLISFESEEKLKASVKVVAECKAGAKGLTLFRDDKDCYYLLAKGEDTKIPAGTHIGGIGGGCFVPYDGDTKRCVRWQLPLGDKTLVQLAKGASEGEGESAKGPPKVISGTLYAIARDIEASATAPPKLTSYGSLIPAGTAGRHHYMFEFPDDHEKHKKMMFQPTPGTVTVTLVVLARWLLG